MLPPEHLKSKESQELEIDYIQMIRSQVNFLS